MKKIAAAIARRLTTIIALIADSGSRLGLAGAETIALRTQLDILQAVLGSVVLERILRDLGALQATSSGLLEEGFTIREGLDGAVAEAKGEAPDLHGLLNRLLTAKERLETLARRTGSIADDLPEALGALDDVNCELKSKALAAVQGHAAGAIRAWRDIADDVAAEAERISAIANRVEDMIDEQDAADAEAA